MGYRPWPWKEAEIKQKGEPDAPSYIVETHRRSDIGAVEGEISGYLAPGWSIAPLFEDAPDETREDGFNLSCFWELRLPGPQFNRWNESPYDLAYDLMDRTGARSIEPDLPTGLDTLPAAKSSLGCNEPDHLKPADRAWALRSIRAPEAWDYLRSHGQSEGKEILIGQPDTGVAIHDDLDYCLDLSNAVNLIEGGHLPTDPLPTGIPFDNPGHGTSTSSVAVSRGGVLPTSTPPQYGTSAPGKVTGVSRDAHIVPIRAIKAVVRLTQGKVAKAVDHARKKQLHVVSMSLGGLPLRALEASISRAVADQIVVISAAGNCVRIVVWPARYRSVIGLGGTNEKRVPWKGSSRGRRVDVCAPAEFVWRALRTKPIEAHDVVDGGQGTSFATAMTAGVAALWLNDRRAALMAALTGSDTLQEAFRRCLKSTADVPPGWQTKKFGAGIVDAYRLLASECTVASKLPAGPPASRESYADQVDETCEEVSESQLPIPEPELVKGIEKLAPGDKERFGHESLALLSQQAWFGAGATVEGANEAGIAVLRPSERLRKALGIS